MVGTASIFLQTQGTPADILLCSVTIFKNPVVTTILLQSFLLGAVYQSYLYYLPMYLQNAMQFSVLKSAETSVALVALQSASSIASGQYISRRKRYGEVLWAGFGFWTLQVFPAVTVFQVPTPYDFDFLIASPSPIFPYSLPPHKVLNEKLITLQSVALASPACSIEKPPSLSSL